MLRAELSGCNYVQAGYRKFDGNLHVNLVTFRFLSACRNGSSLASNIVSKSPTISCTAFICTYTRRFGAIDVVCLQTGHVEESLWWREARYCP